MIEMGADAVAVPANISVEADAASIAKLGPLATVLFRFRAPPLAVIVPPLPAMALFTVPDPVRFAPRRWSSRRRRVFRHRA